MDLSEWFAVLLLAWQHLIDFKRLVSFFLKFSSNSSSLPGYLILAKSKRGFWLWSSFWPRSPILRYKLARFAPIFFQHLRWLCPDLRSCHPSCETEHRLIKNVLGDYTPRESVDPMIPQHRRFCAFACPEGRSPQRFLLSINAIRCWLRFVETNLQYSEFR